MTILLGEKRDLEPVYCIVCGRRAGPRGVCSKVGLPIGWICDNPDCLPLAESVYHMAAKHLDRYEEKAIDAAAGQTFDAFAEVLLSALWSNGVRNLEDMDGTKFKAVADAAQKAPELRRVCQSFLLVYGESVRQQISTGTAPF